MKVKDWFVFFKPRLHNVYALASRGDLLDSKGSSQWEYTCGSGILELCIFHHKRRLKVLHLFIFCS